MAEPKVATRFLASLIAASLIVVAPGPDLYAQVSRIAPSRVNTSLGNGSASAAAGRLGGRSLNGGSFLSSPAPFKSAPLPGGAAPRIRTSGLSPVGTALPVSSDFTPAAFGAADDARGAAPALPGSSDEAPASVPAPAAPGSIAETPLIVPEISIPAAESAPEASGASSARGTAARRIGSRFASLKAFFTGRSRQGLPQDQVPAQGVSVEEYAGLTDPQARLGASPSQAPPSAAVETQNAPAEPPAPPAGKPEDGKKSGKGWLGLGATVAALIGGMLIMQLGLEAQGASMAQLTENAFGDFSILAQVTIFASIGSMVGQQLAHFFSEKFGLTKTFYGAHALRAISLGTMVFLLGTGMMPLPLMFVFYALNGIVTGVAVTAEGTLRKFILAEQGVSQQKFRTWWQLLAEIVAVPAPMVLGALVVTLGAGWITALYPATILLGLMLFMMLKVIPWKAAQRVEAAIAKAAPAAPKAEAPAPGAPKVGAWQKVKNALKQLFANMEEGKDFVFKTPFLKYSLMGAVIFDIMNVLIYRLITPGYGKLVAGSAGMSEVQGNLVGMFSLGGLLLAAFFLIMERVAKKKEAQKTPEELAQGERKSMLRWTLWGVPALALLGVMAFNLALPFSALMFMGVNWVPGTVLAAALIPFGFFQVAASIKLNSYFQEKLPADAGKVQKALAFSGSAMTALSIVLMLILKPLFGDLAAFNPFPWLAAALVPVGVALFFIQRKLAAATKPEEFKTAPNAPVEKTAGGYAGVLLGVVAAALLLAALPFIPGAAGMLAGFGVLGKFLLNAGVALALPVAGWFADRAIRRR